MQIHATAADARTTVAASHLLLAEYIHRSANDFAVACAELRRASREVTLERTRGQLATAFERLSALAAIQRLLQPTQRQVVDLGAELDVLCRLHTQARFAALGVFVELRATDVLVDAQRGWALLAIVSELLTNAARHAFAASGGLVEVEIARRGDDVVCRVSDDGIGFSPIASAAGAGRTIITELACLGGIAFARLPSPVGASFELRAPLAG